VVLQRPVGMADDGAAETLARSRQERRRTSTSLRERGLTCLAVAAVIGIVVVALTASTATKAAMSGPNAWLPWSARVLGVVVFAIVVAVHLWHVRAGVAHERAWHTAHVLMALGMIDMFAPTRQMIVSSAIGRVVFVVAAVATLTYASALVIRGELLGWLWPALAADLAAMVYMFATPPPGLMWFTAILVGWSVLQALGWLTGVLPARADLGTPRGALATTDSGPSRHAASVRISLAAMNLGMGYMFLAMALGMARTPSMLPMPTMPGM
jgi:Domain of unknown function (DUF5134)